MGNGLNMHESQWESLDQMAGSTAAALAQAAAGSALHLFKDEQFRRLAKLEKLSQTEQDRIFNELVIACLVLIMLVLEAPDLRVAGEFRGYLADLKEKVPAAYVDHLKSLGIKDRHLRDWKRVISMRYDEFARSRHDVRAAAMHLKSEEKGLDLEDLSKIQMLVPVQAVAIGCHHHICRGKTDGRDELFKKMLASLSRFYIQVRVRLEGGKITPLKRTRVAVKKILRRLKDRVGP